MILTIFVSIILTICLIVAACQDLKRLEVADWLSFSLIFLGISFSFGVSILYENWYFLFESIVGFGFACLLSFLLYYSGLWGGGDAKIMMGIGAFLGLSIEHDFPFINLLGSSLFGFNLFSFVFFTFLGGTAFGIGLMIYKAIRNWDPFLKKYESRRKKTKGFFSLAILSGLFLIAISFIFSDFVLRITFIVLGIFVSLSYFLYVFVRSVESVAMIKEVPIEKLTPGDWLLEDLMIGNKIVCKKSKTGLSEEEIKLLKKMAEEGKINSVKIKYGFPFVPSFLIALVLHLLFGNFFMFSLNLV